jgi:hypothetical protein
MSEPVSYSGVTVALTARHVDPHLDEGEHEHRWMVTAFYPLADGVDLRCQRAALIQMLSIWQGTVLPPELWSGEAIARTVAQVLANCIGARVTRPEGFEAVVWL